MGVFSFMSGTTSDMPKEAFRNFLIIAGGLLVFSLVLLKK